MPKPNMKTLQAKVDKCREKIKAAGGNWKNFDSHFYALVRDYSEFRDLKKFRKDVNSLVRKWEKSPRGGWGW